MNDLSLPPLNIHKLLREHGLRASKSLGQNFLQDSHTLQAIVRVADISPGMTVLEIGAGLGSLTRYLALNAGVVISVELDRKLFPVLEVVLAPYPNVRIVQGDILKLDPAELVQSPGYIVVANIPYYITSMVIRHLLEAKPHPSKLVLTIQKEVAERICVHVGRLNLLALSVQVYGKPSIELIIPAGAFFPQPKVDSAVLRIEVFDQPLIPTNKLDRFFTLIKAGFSQRRKTLLNALSAGLQMTRADTEAMLRAAEIDPMRRAESLNMDEWSRLCQE